MQYILIAVVEFYLFEKGPNRCKSLSLVCSHLDLPLVRPSEQIRYPSYTLPNLKHQHVSCDGKKINYFVKIY